MKKIVVAIFAVFYLVVSSGFTLHMHYCMGKLAEWGLTHNKSKTCPRCGMEKSAKADNGCCKDEQKFIKNNSDQKTTETGIQLMQLFTSALPASFIVLTTHNFPSVTEGNPASHSPPRTNGIPIHIRYCVFLI